MSRRIGQQLCQLIRDKAYATGALHKVRREIADLNGQLCVLRDNEKNLATTLAHLDVRLAKYAGIDPSRIRAITANPHTTNIPRGVFTREVVRYMSESRRPVSTFELEKHLFTVFGFSPETPKEREQLHRKVRKCLRIATAKGAIKRLHNPRSRDGKTLGLWQWAGR